MNRYLRGVYLVCVPFAVWACGDDGSSSALPDAAIEAGSTLTATEIDETLTDEPTLDETDPPVTETETETELETDTATDVPTEAIEDSGMMSLPPNDAGEGETNTDTTVVPDSGLTDEPTLTETDTSTEGTDADAGIADASVPTTPPILDAAPPLPEIFDALGGDATLVLACEGNCECTGNDCTCGGDSECIANCDESEGCNLSCNGLSDCVMQCNDNCNAVCPGTADCSVVLGPESTASCSGSGDCSYWCEGNCDVECSGSSSCVVTCQDDAATCALDCGAQDAVDCGDGVQVCRSECPAVSDAGVDAGLDASVTDASVDPADAGGLDAAVDAGQDASVVDASTDAAMP